MASTNTRCCRARSISSCCSCCRREPTNGYDLTLRIQATTPRRAERQRRLALSGAYRLEQRGLIRAAWDDDRRTAGAPRCIR